MESSGYADFGFLWVHGEVRSRIECPSHHDGNARFRNYLWSRGLPCAVGQGLDLQHPQEHQDHRYGQNSPGRDPIPWFCSDHTKNLLFLLEQLRFAVFPVGFFRGDSWIF